MNHILAIDISFTRLAIAELRFALRQGPTSVLETVDQLVMSIRQRPHLAARLHRLIRIALASVAEDV
jgi:hypothetical protein